MGLPPVWLTLGVDGSQAASAVHAFVTITSALPPAVTAIGAVVLGVAGTLVLRDSIRLYPDKGRCRGGRSRCFGFLRKPPLTWCFSLKRGRI